MPKALVPPALNNLYHYQFLSPKATGIDNDPVVCAFGAHNRVIYLVPKALVSNGDDTPFLYVNIDAPPGVHPLYSPPKKTMVSRKVKDLLDKHPSFPSA